MYKVIEFEDNALGIIRNTWFTPRKKECLWPPHKVGYKFNKCLLLQDLPEENWPLYTIERVMYETDSPISSNNPTPTNEKLTPTTLRSKSKLTQKTFLEKINSSVDSPVSSNNPTPGNEKTTPTTLRSKLTQKTFLEKINSSFDSPLSSNNPTPTYEESTPTTLRSKHAQKTGNRVMDQSIIEKINSSLDVIAECLGHMKSEIEEMKQTQNDILLRISSSSTAVAALPIEIDMPLNSFDDLINTQNWLQEEDHKEQLIHNLSYIGGKGTGTITRRANCKPSFWNVFSPTLWQFSVTGLERIISSV